MLRTRLEGASALRRRVSQRDCMQARKVGDGSDGEGVACGDV